MGTLTTPRIIAVTGPRPEHAGTLDLAAVEAFVAYAKAEGWELNTGGAAGYDLLVAQVASRLDVFYLVVQPHQGFILAQWERHPHRAPCAPTPDGRRGIRHLYERWQGGCEFERNGVLIEGRASLNVPPATALVAFWPLHDRKRRGGGTRYTIGLARKAGIPVWDGLAWPEEPMRLLLAV